MYFYRKCWFDPFEEQFMSPFLSDCQSLILGIAIHCIQHSQAMLERGVCELAHSFFHFFIFFLQFFVCFGFWFLSFQDVFHLICSHIWWIWNQIISICLLLLWRRPLRRLQHHCWRQRWGWLWRLRLRHCSWIFYTLSDLIFKFASVLELMSNIFNALEFWSID